MRDFMAFLGLLLVFLVIWFLFDFSSLIKAENNLHRAFLQRIVQNELKDPENVEIDGKNYIIIPTK